MGLEISLRVSKHQVLELTLRLGLCLLADSLLQEEFLSSRMGCNKSTLTALWLLSRVILRPSLRSKPHLLYPLEEPMLRSKIPPKVTRSRFTEVPTTAIRTNREHNNVLSRISTIELIQTMQLIRSLLTGKPRSSSLLRMTLVEDSARHNLRTTTSRPFLPTTTLETPSKL